MPDPIATLVLAGSRPGSDPLLTGTGLPSKALLPIAGRPMLAHVLAALEAVLDAVGAIRLRIEGLFSMGLANSPMHNASIQVVCGNFVIAKPVGVRGGFDYQHTGEVRQWTEQEGFFAD